MTSSLLLGQNAVMLVSVWKPLLMVVPFIGWAWIISSRLDKDAKHYHLNFAMWNSIHLAAGALAIVAMLAIPFFFIGWVVGMLVLAGPILAYWHFRNQQVPDSAKFSLSKLNVGQAMEARKQRKAVREAVLRFLDAGGKEQAVPAKDDPALAVHVLAEDLLAPAIAARATRVEMLVTSAGTNVSQLIDGIRYKRQVLPADSGSALLDFFKRLAKLDLADRRRRQAGKFKLQGQGTRADVDVTTAGSSTGLTMFLEFDRAKRLLKPFDGLGLLPMQIEALKALENPGERHGIVLLGAPPGHGLSTSSYSFLNRHDAYTSNIKTLEREIQTELDGVDQVLWDPNNPAVDYATNLQSILRRDPDIVMVSDQIDAETAEVISGPGLQGPLIYIPQRAGSVQEQIALWMQLLGDPRKATRALRAVINQRLMRSLCPNCRQPYQPTADQLKKLNLPAGKIKQLYRANGKVQVKNKVENCAVCGGTGYLGQTAAFEVFIVDEEVRKLLAAKDLKGAFAHARRNKMILLQEAALSKVINGETTLEEVVRVTAPAAPRPGGAPQPREPGKQPDPAATPT